MNNFSSLRKSQRGIGAITFLGVMACLSLGISAAIVAGAVRSKDQADAKQTSSQSLSYVANQGAVLGDVAPGQCSHTITGSGEETPTPTIETTGTPTATPAPTATLAPSPTPQVHLLGTQPPRVSSGAVWYWQWTGGKDYSGWANSWHGTYFTGTYQCPSGNYILIYIDGVENVRIGCSYSGDAGTFSTNSVANGDHTAYWWGSDNYVFPDNFSVYGNW